MFRTDQPSITRERPPPRFHRVSRSGIRRPHPRHRYAHHIRRLTEVIQRLVGELAIPSGGSVLDFGCADMPYRSFLPEGVLYVGADLAGNPDAGVIIESGGTLPVADQSFDAVLSTQVLEHVQDPRVYMAECLRVLRPGGRLLLSTHGVFPYHPDPMDLWRWTCEGLRREVERAGFEVVHFEGVIGMAATGLQLLQDAISYRMAERRVAWLALFVQPIVRFLDRFETPESLSYNAQVFALVARRPL